MKTYYVYILECSDKSFYVGVTSQLSERVKQHNSEDYPNTYVYKRRPAKLVWYAQFSNPQMAIDKEKQIKKWSRSKKQSLINGDYDSLIEKSKKKFG